MIFNKLHFGFALLFLSWLSTENLWIELPNSSKNNFILEKEATYFKVGKIKIQDSGQEIYTDFCVQCHGANGKGDGLQFPPLAGSDWLSKKRTQSIHAVKFGQKGEIIVNGKKFNNAMPAMGLSNKEVTDVMNYIMTSWGNKQTKQVTEKEVAAILP